MSLSTKIAVNVSALLQNLVGLTTASAKLEVIKGISLTSGIGADQADVFYSQQATIADGGTLSLDLKGSLMDALGAAFTPAKIKALLLYSSPANTTDITLFGNAAHVPFLSVVTTTTALHPGGLILLAQPAAAGYPVTATTGDVVLLTNGAGAAAVVDIVLVGTSA